MIQYQQLPTGVKAALARAIAHSPRPRAPGVVAARAALIQGITKLLRQVARRGHKDALWTPAIATSLYQLTDADQLMLEQLIAEQRIAAWRESYRSAAGSVGADLSRNWHIPSGMANAETQAARDAVGSISQTYAQDVASFLRSNTDATAADVASWLYSHAAWKGQQIGNYETSSAAQNATDAAINDMNNGTLSSDGQEYGVAILPEESSSDQCAEWAGTYVRMADVDSLPSCPLHVNCIHYQEIALWSDLSGETPLASTMDPLAANSADGVLYRSTGEQQAVTDFAAAYGNNATETLQILGPDGAVLFTSGSGNETAVGAEMTDAERALQIGNTSVHNHPEAQYGPGQSFSISDIQQAVENQMAGIYVVAPDGEGGFITFSMRQATPETWTSDAWFHTYRDFHTNAYQTAIDKADTLGLTGQERKRSIANWTWQTFASDVNKATGQNTFAYSWERL